jgi:hypothetical protein
MGGNVEHVTARLDAPPAGWMQDLPLREDLLSGAPDGQDELNHLDDRYLEFSMASDIPRGISLFAGAISLCLAISVSLIPLWIDFDFSDFKKNSFLLNAFFLGCAFLLLGSTWWMALQGFRLDLQLPRDRPIRFNRRRGKVYINHYTWSHNPFGKWGGGVKVWDWNTVQACIAHRIGASGEVITQRYDLLLVSCKLGTFEVVDTFRLQQGAMTTAQFDDLWALLRHYMAKGLEGLPPQNLRNPNPGFVDCLLFAMPWLAPTEEGRRARARMQGFLAKCAMVLMTLLFPLWLVFGLGNYIVMKIAPEAVWPPGLDDESRA